MMPTIVIENTAGAPVFHTEAGESRYRALTAHQEAFRVFARLGPIEQERTMDDCVQLAFFGTNDGGPTRFIRGVNTAEVNLVELHKELQNTGHSRLLLLVWDADGHFWRRFEVFRQH